MRSEGVLFSVQQIKDAFIKDAALSFNVSNKTRKEWMLTNDLTIIHHADLYDVMFGNLGGGIWNVYCKKRVSNGKN